MGLEDTAIYERIEIIRGSTGLTNGAGNPSASINYVRKKPTKPMIKSTAMVIPAMLYLRVLNRI